MKLADQELLETQLVLPPQLWDYKNKTPLLVVNMGHKPLTHWIATPSLRRDSFANLLRSPTSACHFEGNRLASSPNLCSHKTQAFLMTNLTWSRAKYSSYRLSSRHSCTERYWNMIRPLEVYVCLKQPMLGTTDISLSCLSALEVHEDLCSLPSFFLSKSTYPLFLSGCSHYSLHPLPQQLPWVPKCNWL